MTEADTQFENYWEGYCAISDTSLPHVQRVGANVFGVVGFSTRGVNLSHNLGRVMGEFAAGRRSLDDIPVAVNDRRKDVSYWPIKVRAARVVFPLFQVMDHLG